VAQGEKSLEPLPLGAAELLPVVEAFASAEQGADGDDQDIDQVVGLGAVDPRVNYIFKMFDKT